MTKINFPFQSSFYVFLILCISLGSCKQDKTIVTTEVKTGGTDIERLTAHIKTNPSDHKTLYQRADLLNQAQRYNDAINDLRAAIKLDSLVPDYYHLLSDCYMDYYRSKDALIVMEEAAALFQKRIPTQLKLSETQFILKQYEPALMTIARIHTVDNQNAEAYFMTGMIFKEMEETDRAINAFQTATELDPELVNAWIILGGLYEKKKDPIALQYYNSATQVDSDNPITWHSLAFYLQNSGKDLEAIEIYKKINVMDKSYVDAYLNAGILYFSMDSLEQAYEQFNIMTAVKPQDFIAYYYRGLIQEAKGDLTLAKEDYLTSLKLNPDFEKAQKAISNLNNG